MRKKELEALALPEPTSRMYRMAGEDKCIHREWSAGSWSYSDTSYLTRMYYGAREQDGILVVSAWARPVLAEGGTDPNFTTYIDVENRKWTTRMCNGKWSRAKIDTMSEYYGVPCTSWRAQDVDDEEGMELCSRILGTQEKTIRSAVLRWQDGIREQESIKRAKKRNTYWKSRMDMIPPAPGDFREWADKEGAGKDHFLFFRGMPGGNQEAFCTKCGQRSEGKLNMQHSPGYPSAWNYEKTAKYSLCPACGALLSTKSWRRQKGFETWGNVILAQPVSTGEIVLRQFFVKKRFHREVDELMLTTLRDSWEYDLTIKENNRIFVDPKTFESVESYEIKNVEHIGYTWAQTKVRTNDGQKPAQDYTGSLYTGNVKEIVRASGIPMLMVSKCSGDNMKSPQARFRRMCRLRYVEYLYRSGLTKLADEIMAGNMTVLIREEAKDLKTLLGLDGQQLWIMKKINGSMVMLENLHEICRRCERADMETLEYINAKGIRVKTLQIDRTGMNLQRTMNYLRRQAGEGSIHDTIMEYRDYLDMAERLGMDLRDEIVCRTPRLKELHDRYAAEVDRQKNAERDASVDRKFKNILRDHDANDEHFRYARGGLVVIVPGKASDITSEGRTQHHCVGASDVYMKRMNDRTSFILFLRRESKKDAPYYTLEVDYSGKIIQAYGAYDRKPDWKEVDAFLAAFSREIGKRTKREQKEADKNARQSVPERVLVEAG